MSGSDVLSIDNEPTDEELEALAADAIEAIERPKKGDHDALASDTDGGWLPQLALPSFGEAYDGSEGRTPCGEEVPHFCSHCGKPIPVGRTCGRSMCPRCWAAWVLNRAGTSREDGEDVPGLVAQLDKTARMMSARLDTAVFKHHLVFSPPMHDWFLEAADPLERTKEVIYELMDLLGLEGVVFYHPWAGDNEDSEGDDRGEWKNRIGEDTDWDDVRRELKPRGHFHVVGCSPYVATDGFTDRVNDATDWVIKRVQKRDDSGRSLSDLDDVANAVTYCLSHTGIDTEGETNQAKYWAYGSTYHSGEVPEDVKQEADAAVRRVAPTTLGIPANKVTCYEEIPRTEASLSARMYEDYDSGGGAGDGLDLGGGDGAADEQEDAGPLDLPASGTETPDTPNALEGADLELVSCDGRLEHIREAESYLEDEDWKERAPYAPKLQTTWEDWSDTPPPD